MAYASPCGNYQPSPGGPSADEIAAAIVARLAGTELQFAQPKIKGETITALVNQTAAGVSTPIPVDKYNAAYVQVMVNGSTPSGVVTIKGLGGGDYQALGDPNATKTITASTAYEVVVGAPVIVVDLSSVSGTGAAYTVYVTPFVSPGSTNLSITTASSVDVSDRAARALGVVSLDTGTAPTVFNPAAVTDNTAHDCLAASGASLKWYLDWLIVTNSHATVGTLVTIQDDTGGTPVVLCQGYAGPAGGFAIAFPKNSPSGGANQKLQVICGTTGANVYVSGAAHKAA